MKKKIIALAILLLALSGCERKSPIVIYTIGDSTMASYPAEYYPLTGWAQVLQDYFDENHVIVSNHATSGRSTKSFIAEGRWQTVVDSLKPGDYVFIQFGHNDQKADSPERYAPARELYTENLQKFVNEIREKKATPVLFTPIIRRKFGTNGKLENTLGEYPDAVRDVSRSMNVLFVDMNQLTTDFINAMGDEPSKEIYLWTPPDEKFPEGRKDNSHLSEKGAREYAKLVTKELSRLKTPLAKHVK